MAKRSCMHANEHAQMSMRGLQSQIRPLHIGGNWLLQAA